MDYFKADYLPCEWIVLQSRLFAMWMDCTSKRIICSVNGLLQSGLFALWMDCTSNRIICPVNGLLQSGIQALTTKRPNPVCPYQSIQIDDRQNYRPEWTANIQSSSCIAHRRNLHCAFFKGGLFQTMKKIELPLVVRVGALFKNAPTNSHTFQVFECKHFLLEFVASVNTDKRGRMKMS